MEEETAAMANQLSSSDVMDETFSKLPEHIMHCILGWLRIKDVVRTSAISKSWLQAWRTFPIREFNLMDFVSDLSSPSPEEVEAKNEHFIRFVDTTLQRFERMNGDGNGNRMKVFNLSTEDNMAHHISHWTSMALDNKVEHLTLRVFSVGSVIPIPRRVLSAYWLKSLVLSGYKICIPFNEVSHVDLPSLTSLRILDSDISDEQLQILLNGCPVLEQISLLSCGLLSKVEIFDHPILETLEVTGDNFRSNLTAISVRAPKLKSFGYTSQCLGKGDVIVKIHNGHGLKSLRINDFNKTDDWLHKFIAQFPLIENLTIERCYALRKIRISNPLLEKINIKNCYDLEDVVISCKKLTSFFLYTRPRSIPKPMIRMEMDNPPNECTAQIFALRVLMEASWYCKLKEFLSRPFTFKNLNIMVITLPGDGDGDMQEKDMHKKLPSAACKIENLSLSVNTNPSCYPYILNGLLSACHPATIKFNFNSGSSFYKFFWEELGNRENNINCWCKDDFKCWKHQLKEVKIEKIIGYCKLEKDLDLEAFFDLLPTLEDEDDIYFKLIW